MVRRTATRCLTLACLTGFGCHWVGPTDVACLIDSPTPQCPEGYVCGAKGYCELPKSSAADSGVIDSGMADSGAFDAGSSDSGPTDAGPMDGGPVDAGSMDAGFTDGGSPAPAPNTAAGGPITYRRVPWGDSLTSGAPNFVVLGTSGAASGDVEVVALAGPTAGSTVLGMAGVNASTGAFIISWSGPDEPDIYLEGKNAAGRFSAIVPVHNIEWVASFGAIDAGIANPNQFEVDQNFVLSGNEPLYAAPLALDPAFTTNATTAQYNQLAIPGDGNVLGSTAVGAMWRPIATGPDAAPSERNQSAGAYDSARGVFVLFGGSGATQHMADTWEWNGRSWSNVTPTTGSPPGRAFHSMAYDAARGVTLLFGGQTAVALVNDTWAWDGTAWTQLLPAASPPPRNLAAMVYDTQRGVDVLFGGGIGNSAINDTWEFNGQTWTQRTFDGDTNSPAARSEHAMAYDSARGKTVLFGGCTGPDFQCPTKFNDTWQWDGTTWTNASPGTGSPTARSDQSMAFDSRLGVTMMFGGATCSAGCVALNDAWQWNGGSWTQVSASGTLPPVRQWATAIYDSAVARFVVFGGVGDTSTDILGDTWVWSDTSGLPWTGGNPGSGPPTPRAGHMMSYDPQEGTTLLVGGQATGSVELGDSWTWDGRTWRNVTPSSANPSARAFSGLAWDSNSGTTLLFGGFGPTGSNQITNQLADTWQWNGSQWKSLSPSNHPTARMHPAMTATPSGDVGLFGGYNGTTQVGETWAWNTANGNWILRVPVPTPPPESGTACVYDSAGMVSLLFGGVGIPNSLQNSTWALSESGSSPQWTNDTASNVTSSNTPSARDYAAMAYDPLRQRTVMFGGDAPGIVGDEWEWDEALTQWTQVPIVTPSGTTLAGRSLAAMTYDWNRGTLVLFGGDESNTTLADDTWESPSDLQRHAAGVATFDFAAAGAVNPSIQSMSFSAWAGGTGPSGNGSMLAVWDAWSGAWKQVTGNVSAATTPAAMNYPMLGMSIQPSEAIRYLAASQTIHVAVYSASGRDQGTLAPQVAIDGLELTVSYQQ